MVVMKRIKKILYYPTLIIIFVLGLYSISNTIINNYYLEEYNMINEDIILVEKNDSIEISDKEKEELENLLRDFRWLDGRVK